ncbi:MAG: ABC transporter ATP-binding protein [Firmicutes bacterium]|nr:ABC transporter ATP-binding protein [Bacillota bacterium]
MDILKSENLSKTYGSGEISVEALKNVDFTVKEGEFVAVVGASGSGKSTLLHLLGGLDKPTNGKVLINDRDIYTLKEKDLSIFRRREIGFIFQFYNLVPVLTAKENITLPLLLDGRTIDKDYIDELLSTLKIKDRKEHLPSALSGGQQQRVAIARALATKPSIIFADEPTGNLDSKISSEVLDLLRISIKKYHQTLVMITHDEEVAKTADRIVTLEDGKIISNEVVVK